MKPQLVQWLLRIQRQFSPDYAFFNVLAALVGITAGCAAIGLEQLIELMRHLFLTDSPLVSPTQPPWAVAIVLLGAPTLGGLLVGLMVKYAAREAKGHGVPEVMEAVAVKGGKIRPRVALVKGLATSITIGSGGAAGHEGPIVLIGSGVGSTVGQYLKLTPYQTKILVSCGAAGGLSATFNTPIAAVFFPIELLIGEFRTRSFIPIVISSVFANITRRALTAMLGIDTTFIFGAFNGTVPRAFELVSTWEFGLYILLGLLAAVVALGFIKGLYGVEDLFAKLRVPAITKPALGGLIVGGIGLAFMLVSGHGPFIMGIGYEYLNRFMDGTLEVTYTFPAMVWFLIALVVFKVVGSSLTLGSGGSGGVFAPSLFMGGMLGGAFGILANHFAPFGTAAPASYVLVGMAAVFASTSRATITAILIIFEMSGSYNIILPLMLACVIADGLRVALSPDSIFTRQLTVKGVRVTGDMAADVLDIRSVSSVMTVKPVCATATMTRQEFMHFVRAEPHKTYPVLDAAGRLAGVVRSRVLDQWPKSDTVTRLERFVVHDYQWVYPDDPLKHVAGAIGGSGQNLIPVVDHSDRTRLLGIVTGNDVVKAYQQHLKDDEERHGLLRALLPHWRAWGALRHAAGTGAAAGTENGSGAGDGDGNGVDNRVEHEHEHESERGPEAKVEADPEPESGTDTGAGGPYRPDLNP